MYIYICIYTWRVVGSNFGERRTFAMCSAGTTATPISCLSVGESKSKRLRVKSPTGVFPALTLTARKASTTPHSGVKVLTAASVSRVCPAHSSAEGVALAQQRVHLGHVTSAHTCHSQHHTSDHPLRHRHHIFGRLHR